MIRPLFQMSGDEARGLLFGLLEADKIQLGKYPDMPSMREMIRDGRVKYDAYDPKEHWKTYKELSDEVRQKGVAYGDCEDLAVAVAAEDQARHGVQSLPYAYTPREGLFHVVTAVPGGAVSRQPSAVSSAGTRVSGTGRSEGRVPFGFDDWPVAMGATSIPGYVLQDPSRAAGMGSFGYAPEEGSNMSRYGSYGAEPRRRGLGGAFRQLGAPLREIGTGVKKGLGLEGGWERRLGEELPGRLGVQSPLQKIQPKEKSAVKAIRKGMDAEARGEAPSPDEDEDLGDLEDLGDEDEEFGYGGGYYAQFGGLSDTVASEMFGGGEGGVQHFDEDIFGEDDDLDLEDDEGGGGGGGGGFHLPKLPSWALPATIGAALGAGAVGLGVALSGKRKDRRMDSSSRTRRRGAPEAGPAGSVEATSGYGDIGDMAAAEMFGDDDSLPFSSPDDISLNPFQEMEGVVYTDQDTGDVEGGQYWGPSLKPWVVPAAVGTAAGLAGLGLGAALFHKKRDRREDSSSRRDSSSRTRRRGAPEAGLAEPVEATSGYGDIGDMAVAEMFGGDEDPYYMDDGERSEYGGDGHYVDDLDNRTMQIEEAYGSEVETQDATVEDVVRANLMASKQAWDSYMRAQASGNQSAADRSLQAYNQARVRYETSMREFKQGRSSFAGLGSLRRSDLFGGDFQLVRDEDNEDDLLLED